MVLVYINISKLVLTLQYAYPNFLFFIQIIFAFLIIQWNIQLSLSMKMLDS